MGPIRFAEKQAETLFRLICCERKTLFRLKKQAEKDGLQEKRTGPWSQVSTRILQAEVHEPRLYFLRSRIALIFKIMWLNFKKEHQSI